MISSTGSMRGFSLVVLLLRAMKGGFGAMVVIVLASCSCCCSCSSTRPRNPTCAAAVVRRGMNPIPRWMRLVVISERGLGLRGLDGALRLGCEWECECKYSFFFFSLLAMLRGGIVGVPVLEKSKYSSIHMRLGL